MTTNPHPMPVPSRLHAQRHEAVRRVNRGEMSLADAAAENEDIGITRGSSIGSQGGVGYAPSQPSLDGKPAEGDYMGGSALAPGQATPIRGMEGLDPLAASPSETEPSMGERQMAAAEAREPESAFDTGHVPSIGSVETTELPEYVEGEDGVVPAETAPTQGSTAETTVGRERERNKTAPPPKPQDQTGRAAKLKEPPPPPTGQDGDGTRNNKTG